MEKKTKVVTGIILAGLCTSGLGIFLSLTSPPSVKEEISFELTQPRIANTVSGEEKPSKNNDRPQLVQPALQKKPEEVAESQTQQTTTSSTQATTSSSLPQLESSTITSTSKEETVQSDKIYVTGIAITYKNGGMKNGQAIIDSDPPHLASTWGGITPFSGNDNMNTHFIGHHWGAFDPFVSLPVGSIITVTDTEGNAFDYRVDTTAIVDTHANDIATGKNLYSEIVSSGGGERVVFQTCTSETERNILFCYPV